MMWRFQPQLEAQDKCLMAFETSSISDEYYSNEDDEDYFIDDEHEVQSNPSHFHNSHISLIEFDKLCELSTKISAKNANLKEEVKLLKLELNEIKKANVLLIKNVNETPKFI